jgi:hypothetical protein
MKDECNHSIMRLDINGNYYFCIFCKQILYKLNYTPETMKEKSKLKIRINRERRIKFMIRFILLLSIIIILFPVFLLYWLFSSDNVTELFNIVKEDWRDLK